MVSASYFGKYKSIIVSVALFILLDASVLLLNFYISFEISEDAVGVNLAGRQRMLSQRMVKSLLDTHYEEGNSEKALQALDELSLTLNLFDNTLSAFDQGGTTKGADGSDVILNKVTSDKAIAAVTQAKQLWEPYKKYLANVLQNRDNEAYLLAAINYGKQNNLELLRLMNDLTVELEYIASSKATRLRIIQTIGISLAIINFFIILFHFLGQLRRGDKALEMARRETQEILDTVNEGLFLVNKDYAIASQRSKKVSSMFGKEDISNYTFDRLLEDLISSKDMETSKRFIGLLFRQDIKSNLISDLNPLRQIEVNIPDDSGGYISKYLSFDFARAYEGKEVKNVLVTVNDITDKVLLEQNLAVAKEQNEQQLEVLTGILHTNPAILRRFVQSSFESFHRINMQLRETAKTESSLRKKLKAIFIEVHNCKGEASALGLDSFQELAHSFESDIAQVQKKSVVLGDDFFPLVVHLQKLIKHAEVVQNLSEKLTAFGTEEKDKTQSSALEEWQHLQHLADSVAKRNGKKVELITSGLTEVKMNDDLKELISQVSTQCIRNAIVHGIEMPEERIESYKSEVGRIDISLIQRSKGNIELSIQDDGRGFNYESLRKKALATGRWTEQELDTWDSKKLISLIFESGFSTAEDELIDAGRGVGMNIIKEKIKRFRGKIRISGRRGSNTRFLITIPPLLGQDNIAA